MFAVLVRSVIPVICLIWATWVISDVDVLLVTGETLFIYVVSILDL